MCTPQEKTTGAPTACFLKQYNMLRSGLPQQARVNPLALSTSNATGLYQYGMRAAAQRDAARWEADTTRKRAKATQEFCGFLSALPGEWAMTMETASPMEVIVFSETLWTHQHKGSWLPDGRKVASPSGHNAMLSMLSTSFIQLGRCGAWDSATGKGNPIDSAEVSAHRAAYRADLMKRGYQEGSAVPMTEDVHRALIRALDTEAAQPAHDILQWLNLLSTALACCYLWDCSQRGKEVGQLELQDITLQNGESAIQALLLHPQDSRAVYVQPLSTKTIKGRGKVPPIPVPAYSLQDEQYSFTARLPAFLALSTLAGYPVTKHIFRPEAKDGTSYRECPQSSGRTASPANGAYAKHPLWKTVKVTVPCNLQGACTSELSLPCKGITSTSASLCTATGGGA